MKKLSLLILLGLFISSCSSDNDNYDGIDCALFDPAFPSLYLRIVDNTGTNLIENGTINPNKVSVEGDFPSAGFRFIPANSGAHNSELDNSLNLYIPNQPAFHYTINLDGIETIDIEFKGESTKIPCDLSYFNPIEANFDGKKLELKKITQLQYVVVVEL